jgi:hypothetical protein
MQLKVSMTATSAEPSAPEKHTSIVAMEVADCSQMRAASMVALQQESAEQDDTSLWQIAFSQAHTAAPPSRGGA